MPDTQYTNDDLFAGLDTYPQQQPQGRGGLAGSSNSGRRKQNARQQRTQSTPPSYSQQPASRQAPYQSPQQQQYNYQQGYQQPQGYQQAGQAAYQQQYSAAPQQYQQQQAYQQPQQYQQPQRNQQSSRRQAQRRSTPSLDRQGYDASYADYMPQEQTQPQRRSRKQKKEQQQSEQHQKVPFTTRVIDFFSNIRNNFRGGGVWGVIDRFLEALNSRLYLLVVVGVLLIFVGLFVNRYISFGGALIMLGVGALADKRFPEEDVFVFYMIVSLATFIIPYLF